MPVKTQRGFSLVELAVVCAIIVILIGIAIPFFQQARIAAHESSAVESVHAIATAQWAYFYVWGVGFAPNLASLGTPAGGCSPGPTVTQFCALDAKLTNGRKAGYDCETEAATGVGTTSTFVASCAPVTIGVTGDDSFCTDESGTMFEIPNFPFNPLTDTACEATGIVLDDE